MNSPSKIFAIIRIIRPSNFSIATASVAVACFLTGGSIQQWFPIVAASLAAACIGAGGMIVNDIFDIEIDRINKPSRPLPTGDLTIKEAIILYVVVSVSGLFLNLFLNSYAQVIAIGAIGLIYLYSRFLKGTPLAGNIIVSGLTGMAFIYGGAVVENIDRAVVPAIFAFSINLGREIVKDMEDVEGDAQNGLRTFPILFGKRLSGIVASVIFALLILGTVIPYYVGYYSIWYLALVVIGVDSILLWGIMVLWCHPSRQKLLLLSNIVKYDMIVGLVAIALG